MKKKYTKPHIIVREVDKLLDGTMFFTQSITTAAYAKRRGGFSDDDDYDE